QKTMDSLQMAQPTKGGFSLQWIWDALAKCFMSLFGCFFIQSTNAPQLKSEIARIAAHDHFVWFYKKEENPLTAFLGNFHPCTIRLWGLQFSCAEAAYQAAKFNGDRPTMQRFQNLDGEAAFRLGRDLSRNWSQAQKNMWQNNNLSVMRQVVTAKFTQN